MDMDIFATEGQTDVKTYQDAILLAGKILLEHDAVDEAFSRACIDRETNFPTGLFLNEQLGIAIPHASSKLVKRSAISFVRLKEPVSFGRMEDANQKVRCNYLFNLALADGNQHLTMLRQLMRLFPKQEFIDSISKLPIKELPEYLINQF